MSRHAPRWQKDLDWRTLLPNPDPKISGHTYRGVRIPASTFWTVAMAYWETDGNSDVSARWRKDGSKRVIGMGSAYVSFRLTQKEGNGVLAYFQAGFAAYGLGPTVDLGGSKSTPTLRVVGRRKVLRLLGFAFAHACDDYAFGQPQICNTKFRDLHLLLWLCTYDFKTTDDTVALDVIHGMRKVTRHDLDHDRRTVLKHGTDRPKAESLLGLPPGSSVDAADHITRIADDASAQRLIRLTSVIAASDAAYFDPSTVDGGIGGDGGVSSRSCKRGYGENGTFRVRTRFSFSMELTGLPTLIAMTVALGLPPRVARIDGVDAYIVVAELTQARPERFASSTIPGTVDLQPLGINTKRVNQLTLARIGFDLGTTRDKARLHAWIDLLYDLCFCRRVTTRTAKAKVTWSSTVTTYGASSPVPNSTNGSTAGSTTAST